ncbi:MAG: hypothetical protein K2Y26_02995 [Gemmatimonadaceae bacterium]|nr:hypothetical protein [Gemmatimonadaceae bacterium]
MTANDIGVTDGVAPGGGRRIILDGCTLLNLFASRRIADIFGTMPHPFAVADYVANKEALWVGRHRSGPSAECERVDIGPLISSGLIEVLTLDGDEEVAHFLALVSSARIDDGEAMSGALAHARGLVVATDDRAALRVFGSHTPPISTCSTADLVKHWAECAAVDVATLQRVLIDIRERGCFEPGSRDPLQGWWRAAMSGSGAV